MEWSAKSSCGLVRADNEDSWVVQALSDRTWVAMVADGLGGYDAGEVASALAVKCSLEYVIENSGLLPPHELLREAMVHTNRKIVEAAAREGIGMMGTTLTIALLFEEERRLVVGHVGDSRAYLYGDGKIRQVTEDHSMVGELVRNGSITEEDAMRHPAKNTLTAAMGTGMTLDVSIYVEEIGPGDIVILCTDGLTGLVSTKEIGAIVASSSRDQVSDRYVDVANERGGYDNVTVVVLWPDVDAGEVKHS